MSGCRYTGIAVVYLLWYDDLDWTYKYSAPWLRERCTGFLEVCTYLEDGTVLSC